MKQITRSPSSDSKAFFVWREIYVDALGAVCWNNTVDARRFSWGRFKDGPVNRGPLGLEVSVSTSLLPSRSSISAAHDNMAEVSAQ